MKAKIKLGSFKDLIGTLVPFITINGSNVYYFFLPDRAPRNSLVVKSTEIDFL